jgi:hypothetical protein
MSEAEIQPYVDDENSKEAARKRAAQIKRTLGSIGDHIEKLPGLIIDAKKHGDHYHLGYKTWTAYVHDQYETHLIKLDARVRRVFTRELQEHGFSTREIAAVTNVNQATAVRDANASRPRAPRAAKPAKPATDADLSVGNPTERSTDPEIVDAEIVRDTFGDGLAYAELAIDEALKFADTDDRRAMVRELLSARLKKLEAPIP